MHARLTSIFLICAALFSTAAFAQAAAKTAAEPLVQEQPPLEGRKNQKVEKIHIEDSDTIIDEVRYGGQTQSVTVQPKGSMPAYEITPSDMARTRPGDNRDGFSSANGRSVWNVMKF